MEVDKDKLLAAMKVIEKQYGEGSVYGLDTEKSVMKIPRWSTGIEDLDAIIGGGMPLGRLVEISGPESSGKTSLAYHLMAQHDYAVDIPVEGTFEAERAKVFGNRKGQLVVRRAEYGEQCLESTYAFADAGIPCIVIDSIPHMIPKKQFEETNFEKDARIGGVAGLWNQRGPAIAAKCERTGTTLICVNQVRDSFNPGLFGPKTHTPGGRWLKFAYSMRIEVARREWIKVPNKNPMNTAAHETVGMIQKIKVVKSKVCNPMQETLLVMFFDRGYVAYDQIEEVRKEIMRENNRKAKEGKFDYMPKEDGSDE